MNTKNLDEVAKSIHNGFHGKAPHYTKPNGDDLIDRWAREKSTEDFRVIMSAQIEKYNDRIGKKDDIIKELDKIIDCAQRWKEYEKSL